MDETQAKDFFNKSAMRDCKLDCLLRHGPEKCGRILNSTFAHFCRLAEETQETPETPTGRHIYGRLIPALAYFLALRENGVPEEEAGETVAAELQRYARQQAAALHNLLRLPFHFALFRGMSRRQMPRDFPAPAFDAAWARNPGGGVSLRIRRCLYKDFLEKHGAASLCPAFCRAEQTKWEGLLPKIGCTCASTLVDTAVCVFHFQKNHGAAARQFPSPPTN